MTIRRILIGLFAASLLVAMTAGLAGAAKPAAGRHASPASATRRHVIDTDRRIDVNNLNLYLANNGAIGYDLTGTFPGGLFYPKGTAKTGIYASGLWLGAKVNGQLRTVVAEYDQEFRPGRLISNGNFDNPSNPALVTYKVVRFTGDPSDTSHVELANPDASTGQDPVVHHSWSEYVNGAKPYGAPTRIYHLPSPDGVGPGVDVEGPDVLGDMMCWSVYNDGDPATHTNEAGSSAPLNVQIQQTTFAFNRQGPRLGVEMDLDLGLGHVHLHRRRGDFNLHFGCRHGHLWGRGLGHLYRDIGLGHLHRHVGFRDLDGDLGGLDDLSLLVDSITGGMGLGEE